MTSEVDGLKTNEFLRRRKLRLQQVREQSKEIAKKIRQRANVEKSRQVNELDAKKQKEYLQRQEKLVRQLERFYAEGIQNIGVSHKNASEVRLQDDQLDKLDLSKQRGKNAAVELRRRKQEKLDEQKRLLDRKLHARESANIISREKSCAVINKLQSKSSNKDIEDTQSKSNGPDCNTDNNDDTNIADKSKSDVTRNDMATQWDGEELPNEWEANIPTLSLPKDEKDSIKESHNIESKSDKSKRMDLFALSEEMPSSLRGKDINTDVHAPTKSSLTLVSEYLQNRGLRLRETDTSGSSKKMEDLQSLKQTILRTRASKEGITNVCHVHDEELVPVPSWQEVSHHTLCPNNASLNNNYDTIFRDASNWQIMKKFSAHRPPHPHLLPGPVLRGTSPFRRSKYCVQCFSGKGSIKKSSKIISQSSDIPKKGSITVYNHSTRDTTDIPNFDQKFVVRDKEPNEDAYAQAVKESSLENIVKEHHHKVQDIRSRVAMTKQSVEKEYKETMSFLNALPKDNGNKPIKTAYMDDHSQQMAKDSRQHKLQNEFRKVEKECRRHTCKRLTSTSKERGDEFIDTDFHYSWMPVPESDGNLAIHTIPTKLKEVKQGNSVKFSKIDSYHEYRSRHKHTPPTKDTQEKRKRVVVVHSGSDSESHSPDTSISDNIPKENEHCSPKETDKLSDAERIIIYKILDSKFNKKAEASKLIKNFAKTLTMKEQNTTNEENQDHQNSKETNNVANNISFEQLNEGIYKKVSDNHGDNIASMYFRDRDGNSINVQEDGIKNDQCCYCNKRQSSDKQKDKGTCERGDNNTKRISKPCSSCESRSKETIQSRLIETTYHERQPSAATSTSTFQTAANDKSINALSDKGLVKFIDDGGKEAGTFYIGASGLLKNEAYEVVIQLRKKEDEKDIIDNKEMYNTQSEQTIKNNLEIPSTSKVSISVETSDNVVPKTAEIETATFQFDPEVPKDKSLEKSNSAQNVTVSNVCDVMVDANLISPTPNQLEINKKSASQINLSDKGVCTSFQDSFAILSHIPKTDLNIKPAISTYTQTSTNSPIHRPVFFHMSSSTSTAYMSPPEFILPNFLRQSNHTTEEDFYDHRSTDTQDILELPKQKQYFKNDICRCQKCKRTKKNKATCTSQRLSNVRTPPNTARSCCSVSTENYYREPPSPSSKSKCKCRKCEIRTIHANNKPFDRKKIRHVTNKQSRTSSMRTTSNAFNNKSKSNLKPILKNYVDKLLALNRESLKAVQVVDQECSSVNTPGSSIIETTRNIDYTKPLENKISLEQIKTMLQHKILVNSKTFHDAQLQFISKHENNHNSNFSLKKQSSSSLKLPKASSKKATHKVKSLNISKNLVRPRTFADQKKYIRKMASSTSSAKENDLEKVMKKPSRNKVRSKSSPTPRSAPTSDIVPKSADSDVVSTNNTKRYVGKITATVNNAGKPLTNANEPVNKKIQNHRATTTSPDSDLNPSLVKRNTDIEIPMGTTTQTSTNVDSEIYFMKLAEDKLQNMEKIADLTEKCTQRLSNLAKVLEEVRKNKTLAYSQISSSDTTTESDHKSDKDTNKNSALSHESHVEIITPDESKSSLTATEYLKAKDNTLDSTDYVPFLSDIPKPGQFLRQSVEAGDLIPDSVTSNKSYSVSSTLDHKAKGKPPPALSRIHLKNSQDYVVPHELSTVVEVDSPMSLKLKSQTSRNDTNLDIPENITIINKISKECNNRGNCVPQDDNVATSSTDLVRSNIEMPSSQHNKFSTVESSDDSRMQMIDMRQFNDIMLKPFFSLQEYANQCNIGAIDDGSNVEDIVRDDLIHDEISSLHSDGSIPDVISELLKRNIISEPFKFDSGSNTNSTTISTESTLSVLALSKARKEKKKTSVMFHNKENIETSDSLSISSNPDLENAFKKLGMGWASSTLKKTKERLALSSSSNTSSSSLSQFKIGSFNQDIPVLVSDSKSSVLNSSKNPLRGCNTDDISKNAEQQTSITKSMTVKEFLTTELANKITFTNKSRNDTEEFVSLFETKMPEEMKHSSQMICEEHSIDNTMHSGNNNRARTSTPVQLFKTMTYRSSSSSNMSNGLFSNADDLSSVKVTSNSMKHSTSDKDDLIIPNLSLRLKKDTSECSKSD